MGQGNRDRRHFQMPYGKEPNSSNKQEKKGTINSSVRRMEEKKLRKVLRFVLTRAGFRGSRKERSTTIKIRERPMSSSETKR